jgi:RimJ/RimL family protein N-acetyltransferase
MSYYILSTERLGLRRWLDSDIKPFAEMNNDVDVMRFFPKILTDTETLEMVQRINLHFDKNGFGLFAVENKLTKEFIGFTGFAIPTFDAFFTPCVEIGWRYKKEVWGQGFATEAANACLKYGFDILEFDKIVSFTSILNVNSEKVMRRIGMAYVAEFEHPKVEHNSILRRHVLYQINKK